MRATQLTPGGRSARGQQVAEATLAVEHVDVDQVVRLAAAPEMVDVDLLGARRRVEQLARERAEDRLGVGRAVGERGEPADAGEQAVASVRATPRYPYP